MAPVPLDFQDRPIWLEAANEALRVCVSSQIPAKQEPESRFQATHRRPPQASCS
jgi:hypothetical protein